MRFRPRPLSWCLSATWVFGLSFSIGFAAVGCAGAGTTTPTGAGGASSPGGGGSSSPGGGGSSAGGTTGVGGTTGAGGTSSGGSGGSSTGIAGSSSSGSGGVAGASSGAGGTSSGGSGGSASGGGGSSNPGTAGTAVTGVGGTTGAGGTGGICQMAQLEYIPKIPTVYLVVDRSGSMFHCLTTSELVCSNKADTSWTKLKDAIQTVITSLQAEVRFGFTTIYGTNPAGGGSCPLQSAGTLADNVPPKLNNATDIKTKYDALSAMWPNPSDAMNTGKKLESPAMYAITATAKALMADTTPGDKYMLFLTDGQEDYCDDALEICASDSTVGALQTAFAANIRTIVFGLQTMQFNLPPGVLQAFANAGAGETTVPGLMAGLDTIAIFDQCQGVMPWRADLTASGHPTTRDPLATVGTYGTPRGPTTPFQPNAADQNMLVTQLGQALAGVKSCTFDLNDVGGKSIKVDTTKLAQAHVRIEGTEVPLSATNGWNVDAAAPTQLVFTGTACTTWRNPASKKIDLEFPCGSIIFE
jgi:hypothetical protein